LFLFATTASAQFSKGVPKTTAAKGTDTTERKVADRGRTTDRTAKATEQANSDTELANALLAIMDTDGDGVVSKAEMTKAMAVLRKAHKDSKGNIEFERPADSGNTAGAGDATQGGRLANGAGGGRGNDVVAGLMQYDRNRDGVLSADEVPPQAKAMLQGADLNNDGVIDARELAAFNARMGQQLRALGLGAGPGANGVPGDGGGRKPPRDQNK
jgi:Ca2+-binding EF-hand superfamily protein